MIVRVTTEPCLKLGDKVIRQQSTKAEAFRDSDNLRQSFADILLKDAHTNARKLLIYAEVRKQGSHFGFPTLLLFTQIQALIENYNFSSCSSQDQFSLIKKSPQDELVVHIVHQTRGYWTPH